MTSLTPLTVIGGFLGAGKTTLVNHLLLDAARINNGVRYAVLVNDFGDLAIDENLITKHDGQTIALANGCICCMIGDDLVETIMDLMEGPQPPEHLIIETSGVADPAPVSELGSLDPNLARDLTIVVVDAEQVESQWADDRLRETVKRQIEAADLLVVNKTGALDPEAWSNLEAWLETQAPGRLRVRADDGRVPLSLLGDQSRRSFETGTITPPVSRHNHSNLFHTRTLDISPDLTLSSFRSRLQDLPVSVLRAKGHLVLEGTSWVAHKVGSRVSLIKTSDEPGPDFINRLVTISLEGPVEPLWFD
jgi:G3E family GTPase